MNDSPVAVRAAEHKDVPAMAGLLMELFSVEEDFVPDRARQEKGLAMLLETDAVVLCAESSDGEVVGMITMQRLVSTASGGYSGLIEDVVIGKDSRGRGIGRMLLEEITSLARNEGYVRLQLVADSKNTPAHAFYRKQGWKTTSLEAWQKVLKA